MTDETHGAAPDEAPVPPTSTRWSEDAVAEDDAPPPPFVPGRQEPPGEATPGMEATEPEPFPFDLHVDAEERYAVEEEAATVSAEDDFPFEEFDIEGKGGEAGTQDHAALADAAGSDPAAAWSPADILEEERKDAGSDASASSASPDTGAVEEAAALLDRLAGMLRSDGEAAMRRELHAPDRLTAVLAGILAGYLSGRS